MNDSSICPRKITLLKEKIIHVGKLVEQCQQYKEKHDELETKHSKCAENMKIISQQYLQMLSAKQNLTASIEKLKNEGKINLKIISDLQLQITQLNQVIDVYKIEREEYGREKVTNLEQKLQRAINELMGLSINLKKPGYIFKPFSNLFLRQFKNEIQKFRKTKLPVLRMHASLPSPAWSMASSAESGFESMISSPCSINEEEIRSATVVTALRDDLFDKNDEKPLSMLRDDEMKDNVSKNSLSCISENHTGDESTNAELDVREHALPEISDNCETVCGRLAGIVEKLQQRTKGSIFECPEIFTDQHVEEEIEESAEIFTGQHVEEEIEKCPEIFYGQPVEEEIEVEEIAGDFEFDRISVKSDSLESLVEVPEMEIWGDEDKAAEKVFLGQEGKTPEKDIFSDTENNLEKAILGQTEEIRDKEIIDQSEINPEDEIFEEMEKNQTEEILDLAERNSKREILNRITKNEENEIWEQMAKNIEREILGHMENNPEHSKSSESIFNLPETVTENFSESESVEELEFLEDTFPQISENISDEACTEKKSSRILPEEKSNLQHDEISEKSDSWTFISHNPSTEDTSSSRLKTIETTEAQKIETPPQELTESKNSKKIKISKIFASFRLPELCEPLPKRPKRKSIRKTLKRVECWTQTENFLEITDNDQLSKSDLIMFKHFKMFVKMFKKRKRCKPERNNQWLVKKIKKRKIETKMETEDDYAKLALEAKKYSQSKLGVNNCENFVEMENSFFEEEKSVFEKTAIEDYNFSNRKQQPLPEVKTYQKFLRPTMDAEKSPIVEKTLLEAENGSNRKQQPEVKPYQNFVRPTMDVEKTPTVATIYPVKEQPPIEVEKCHDFLHLPLEVANYLIVEKMPLEAKNYSNKKQQRLPKVKSYQNSVRPTLDVEKIRLEAENYSRRKQQPLPEVNSVKITLAVEKAPLNAKNNQTRHDQPPVVQKCPINNHPPIAENAFPSIKQSPLEADDKKSQTTKNTEESVRKSKRIQARNSATPPKGTKRKISELFDSSPEESKSPQNNHYYTPKKTKINAEDLFGPDSDSSDFEKSLIICEDDKTESPKSKFEYERPHTRSQKSNLTSPVSIANQKTVSDFKATDFSASLNQNCSANQEIKKIVPAAINTELIDWSKPKSPKMQKIPTKSGEKIERPVTKTVPSVIRTTTQPDDEPWTDYKKIKPRFSTINSLEPAFISATAKYFFNFEDMTEKSKMLKMKPSVLSQQTIVTPVNIVENFPQSSIHPPAIIQKRTKPAILQRHSKPAILQKPTTGNLFTDIMANMAKPPTFQNLDIVHQPEQKENSKKSARKRKNKPIPEKIVVTVPEPTFKDETDALAWKAIDQFLTANNDSNETAAANLKTCISALNPISDIILVKTVVKIVIENVDESIDTRFSPPAPPLTTTQHRLFALMNSYKRFSNLYSKIIDEIGAVLMPERYIWGDDTVESCAMFLGGLYRHIDDCVGAVKFCVDVAALMRQRGCLVINAVLAAWPEILPLAANADTWGPGATVAALVMSMPVSKRLNQAASLKKLKTLLADYYGYSREIVWKDWSSNALAALRKGDLTAGCALSAAVPCVECAKHSIVEPLMEWLGLWEFGGISDELAEKVLDILTLAMKTRQCNPIKKDTVKRFNEILQNGKVSHRGEELIVQSICLLSNDKNDFYPMYIEKWEPKEAVSGPVYAIMMTAMRRSNTKKKKKKKKKRDS